MENLEASSIEPINPILFEFFHRYAVSNLSDKKREIYQFIENKENQLEIISLNEKEFIQLMSENSPYKAAADYFSLDILSIKNVMDEAQDDIDRVINEKCNRMKWIDCTEKMRKTYGCNDNQWSFIFVS
ncbi:hypothetical protein F7731_15720 [Cytobacillus depressus]|uniref:Uncharacterized protein n=1 Tax=Cytobacillus depressus TaxID=1602942 RepID=A0A6L3V8N2_9BACI|nr:hypothetical protein [Cytobacillus depressus]KAB2333305.1 hypothetical protein F7731_15720 [Cytobacillus depressus]